MYDPLTYSEKQEHLSAQLERFRKGEIGPATFRQECNRLRLIPPTDIDDFISELSNECADSILQSRGYGKGQD